MLKPSPRPFGPAGYLARRHPELPFVFLRQLTWSYDSLPAILGLALQCARFRKAYPGRRLVILTNTEPLAIRLRRFGVDAFFASSNIFVDETLFRPLPDRVATFDAIYNAQLNPYKRHHLAQGIASCAYITYLPNFQSRTSRRERITTFKAGLPDGHVVLNTEADDNFLTMSESQVNEALNGARVGLCLSKVEGQMYASIEYLLAGLPVVTTRSRGGRDVYLHPDTSIVARDDPRDIRDAVAAMTARAVPREAVRAQTLRLVQPDRERFNAFVETITRSASRSDPRWSFRYVHKLVAQVRLGDLEAYLDTASTFLGL